MTLNAPATYRLSLTLAALLTLSGLQARAAGVDTTSIVAANADLNFVSTLTLRHTLNATQAFFSNLTLTAGQLLAEGVVDNNNGVTNLYAVRFTPGGVTVADNIHNCTAATLTGRAGANNKISLELCTGKTSSATTGDANPTKSGDWMYNTKPVAVFNYRILANGAQTVAADIYPVSVDAANWIK